MGVIFQNLMETLVINKLDEINHILDCCKCEKCQRDIIALVLNGLPSKYVTTDEGAMLAKLEFFSLQHEADVVTALIRAAEIIKKNPKHEQCNKVINISKDDICM